MRVLALFSLLLAGISPVAAQMMSSPSSSAAPAVSTLPSCSDCTANDTSVVKFAMALQNLTNTWYSKMQLNTSMMSSAPNNSVAEWLPNFQGMKAQSQLGVLATKRQGSQCPMWKPPQCNYTIPKPTDAKSLLQMTYKLEASVCGALIGLSGYTLSPEVSFLVARLAANHATHATYVGSHLMEPFFNASNATLIPAFPPAYVVMSGNQTGMLGRYLNGCVKPPSKPCGKSLIVGPISGNLTSNPSAISSARAKATATG